MVCANDTMPRELILLSAYTPPTQHALSLAAEDTACWLNAWTALWHPAALAGADRPAEMGIALRPRSADRGTHLRRSRNAGRRTCPAIGTDRVRNAGAAVFSATADRAVTLDNLQVLCEVGWDPRQHFDWPPEEVRPFFGLGLAYLTVETLFEAMEHERLLDRERSGPTCRRPSAIRNRRSAHLRTPRRSCNPPATAFTRSTIHLLDFALLGDDRRSARGRPDERR